uniref:Kinetochore protein Nuf2 N-terminal domain-containing protein n=1 Tax=Sinocyclocheilus rhinocerous TaxID=307959 RepID=A0A673I8L3_9TELE
MAGSTFPVYKVDAIVQFYRTEVLTGPEAKHFSKSDITPSPKAESVQRVFIRVLQLFRFKPECHYVMPLSENVQHQVLYEWLTPIMSVYIRMCEFLPFCHVFDFWLNDLINPTCHVVGKKVCTLTQRYVGLSTLKHEMVNLKSQIVESPEELRNEMERMKENVKNIRMSKELLDERLVEMQMLVQCVNQLEAEIQVFLKQLQDLQSNMCKTYQQKEEARSLAALNETLQKELKSLSNEEGQLKRALALKLDKEAKQQIRRQKKREVKDQQVRNIYGQYDKIHQKREEIVKMIEENNRETKKLREKMQELGEKCNRQTQKAQEFYEHLLTTVEHYDKRIESIVVETNADTLKMKSHF